MTSALGLKLQEAIEAAEARKAMAQWNEPTPVTTPTPTPMTTTTTKPSTTLSAITFNMVRDNPGLTKAKIIDMLEAQGHKPASTTSLLSVMVNYGIIIQEAGKVLRAVGTKYKSRVEFNPRLKQKPGPKPKRKVTEPKQEKRLKVTLLKTPRPEWTPPVEAAPDVVNHPAHYKVGGIETIDFIEAKQLSYHLGNAVKYITRADHKGNALQDLQKAQWYLTREIKRVQS